MANAADGYQWNADNAFDEWDLNPLAQKVGAGADGVRDTLATGRDAFLQPQMQQYRNAATAAGTRVDEGDEQLWKNEDFRNYTKTGQTNFAPQTPTQAWSQQQTYQPVTGLPVTGSVPGPQPGEAAPTPASRNTALFDQLMQRIQQPITPDANDPTIRRQADAYSASAERAKRNYLADTAEQGGPYQNMQGEERLASERAGQASGAFEAELFGREQDARRESIQKDLSLYGGLLGADEQRQLQEELGLLGDATTRRGQDTASVSNKYNTDSAFDRFMRQLGLDQYDTTNKWDYNWAALAGNGAGE